MWFEAYSITWTLNLICEMTVFYLRTAIVTVDTVLLYYCAFYSCDFLTAILSTSSLSYYVSFYNYNIATVNVSTVP